MYNAKYYRKTEMPVPKLFFGNFYGIQTRWKRYLISIVASIIIAITAWLFFQYSGIYTAGLASFAQGFSRLSSVLVLNHNPNNEITSRIVSTVLFWTLFAFLNIPLIIFSYYRVGKNFTRITVISFLISDVVGLGLSFIPNVEKIVDIFGQTSSSYSGLEKYDVKILLWEYNPDQKIYDLVRIVPLFFYAVVGSLIAPFAYAVIYIVGSSTGGTDFVSYYFSIKKHKPLGTTVIIFNTVSLFIGTFIGSYIAASLANVDPINRPYSPWGFELLFSPNLIVSALGAVIAGIVIDRVFPKNKMVKIKIYSNHTTKIVTALFESDYSHSFTYHRAIGAFNAQETTTVETICHYIEIPTVIKKINQIDPKAFVTVTQINQIIGTMNVLEKID
ncbi:YitT family protein, DUF2179 domain-containing protein [[Mycoplasma] cavipharyngis]|uniref:DUF2179 domain-containing protein n=1 Tax=[Mycoplasma] cavipharyngis TaxID=92757 RepID=UPI0037047B2A